MPFKNPHPLYSVWQGMKRRCDNPNFPQYRDYGGRGIKVCPRWERNFHAFVEDMGPRPDGYSLDRIDNDDDYTPENCRWSDRKSQQRNQRVTRRVTVDGKEYIAVDLADIAGVTTNTIIARAKRGLSYDEVTAPASKDRSENFDLGRAVAAEATRKKTHCPHGHEYTPKNTIVTRQGWRRCRTCFYAKEKKRRVNKPY